MNLREEIAKICKHEGGEDYTCPSCDPYVDLFKKFALEIVGPNEATSDIYDPINIAKRHIRQRIEEAK